MHLSNVLLSSRVPSAVKVLFDATERPLASLLLDIHSSLGGATCAHLSNPLLPQVREAV